MKKRFLKSFLLIMLFFGMNSVLAAERVACGNVSGIPEKIPQITSRIVTIAQVAVPVLLILFGAFDFVKGLTSGKDDEIQGKRKTFVKRLIIGAMVFFIVAASKLLVSVVADSVSTSNISSCIDCFINSSCSPSTASTTNNKKVKSGTAGTSTQKSNLSEKAENNKSSKEKSGTNSNVIANNGSWVGVEVGSSIDLPSSVKISGATYTSADTSIATVDSNGKVKGIKRGQTVITVASGSTNKKVNARVVAKIKSSSSYSEPDCYDIHEGQTYGSNWWASRSTPYVILRLGITQHSGQADCREDTKFDQFVKSARANNIEVGAYYFTKAQSVANAEVEAKYVLNILSRYDKGTFSLPIYIDYEDQTNYGEKALPRGKAGEKIINKFCDIIESGGYYCGIYASEKVGIFNAGLNFSKSVKSFWIANYNSKPTISGMDIWQYSGQTIDKSHMYKNLSTIIINSGYNNFK